MRIAFDARTLQGAPRGMGVYASNLVAALAAQHPSHEIVLLTDRRVPAPNAASAAGFEVRAIGGAGGTVGWEQVQLPRALRGFDLLHAPANIAPLTAPCPVIVTLHDAIFIRRLRDISERTYPRQVAGHWYRRWVIPVAARRAVRILTVSEASRRVIAERLGIPGERVTVTGEALSASFAAATSSPVEAVRSRYSIPEGPYLMALGAFERRKNIGLLFSVMSLLASRMKEPPSLLLAGSENLRATRYEDEVHRRGLQGRVRFLPFLPEEDLKGLMGAALAFCFPSREEGFGLPLLEAMSCGTPVVAADIAASRETAGEAAILVDPDDAPLWARIIADLAGDSGNRTRIVEKGMQRLALFSWERTANLTLEAYQRALAAG